MTDEKRAMTTGAQVASLIRKRILTGEYPANHILKLSTVAEDANCSKTPVRDAFMILAAEDLVEITPNRGTIVKELTRDIIEDHYWIREYLETEACARACRSLTRKTAIRLALEQGQRAMDAQDFDAFNEANIQFHYAIWNAAASPKLTLFLSQLWNGLALDSAITEAHSMSTIQSEHESIWNAIDLGDETWAKASLKHHLDRSLKTMLKQIHLLRKTE